MHCIQCGSAERESYRPRWPQRCAAVVSDFRDMAKRTGFEPVISYVTGRRLNRSTNAPREKSFRFTRKRDGYACAYPCLHEGHALEIRRESDGAQGETRTHTAFRPLTPQASASTIPPPGQFVFGDRIANVTVGERPLGRILRSFEFVLQVATPYPEPPKTLPATSAAPAALCLSCSKCRVTRLLEAGDVLVVLVAQVGLEPTTSWL